MYNQDRVNTALYKWLGWRQPTKSGLPTLDADNLTTNSGQYFEDGHHLVTIENIYNSQPDSAISDANFNIFLDNMQKAAINKMLTAVFTENDIKENKVLYPFENKWTNTIDNGSDFVGYEFNVTKSKDIAVIINSITLDFNDSEDVKLYLYHSSQNTAISTETVTTVADSSKETAVSWVLESMKYQGGKYYIGYYTDGLTAKAVNRDFDNANLQSCYNYVGIKSIRVPNWTTETLFDVELVEYESETYGMNFDISGVKDYTSIIEQNKYLFTKAIQLQMVADVLELIYTTVRSNSIERSVQETAYNELNRTPTTENPFKFGVMERLNGELRKVKDSFLSKVKLKTLTLQ